MGLKLWFRATRVPFMTATIIPVLTGYLMAWHDASAFIGWQFLLTLAGACLIHAATNMVNDYFDSVSGCDTANLTPTPFSGGSRVIQEGLMSPRKVLWASLVFFAAGSLIGLYLNAVCGGNVILILGVTGVLLAFFYSAKPLAIGYRGFGELATGFGFGPLMVMGAYYVGARTLPLKAFLISLPVGILISLVLLINEFPDRDGDLAVNKRTWVVGLGKEKAAFLYRGLLVAAYGVILGLTALRYLPVYCLAVFFSLPLAVKAFRVSKERFDKIGELLPANAATIGLHSLICLLICAGIVTDKFFPLFE